MDSLEDFCRRNKTTSTKEVCDACFKGLFPSWSEDLTATQENEEAQEPVPPVPKPIFTSKNGDKWTAFQQCIEKAEKKLGIKLLANATWLFPFFDVYVQVTRIDFIFMFIICF
jgi:hypothetical protein